jgi:6-phosphogluconolactonase (cycloisomerase 2 family)
LSAGGNAVASYNFDKSKGGLTIANPAVATGAKPVAIAIDPSSQHLYALNQGSNNISAYSIDATTGVLTPLVGSPFATLTNPVSFALTTKGNILYVVSAAQGLESFTVNADGTLVVAQGAIPAGVSPAFVTVDPADRYVYVADSGGNSVVGFTVSGSSLTAMSASVSAGTSPSALAVDSQSKFVFAANQGSNNVSVFSIGSSGALTQVQGSPFTAGTGPVFLAVDQAGNHLFVADHGSSDVAEFSIADKGSLSPVSGSPVTVQTTPVWITVTD